MLSVSEFTISPEASACSIGRHHTGIVLDKAVASGFGKGLHDESDLTLVRDASMLRLSVAAISPHPFRDTLLPKSLDELGESSTAVAQHVKSMSGQVDGVTEYTKLRRLMPNALVCNDLLEDLTTADQELAAMMGERGDKTKYRLRVSPNVEFAREFAKMRPGTLLEPTPIITQPPEIITIAPSLRAEAYNPSIHQQVRSLRSEIAYLKNSVNFDIWIRQPLREICKSLLRSCQKEELDFEVFLKWFRESQLRVYGPELDPYIVEILLGMPISGNKIRLPGDLENLKDFSEADICAAIIKQARKRKRLNEDGLVHCGHCGCLLVGELKKGRYVYYHCTGNRGKCPEPYTREEVLSSRFANVLQDLIIPPAILDWLGDAVLDSDRTEQATRAESIKRLKGRYDQIDARIETMYMDKLDGRITQELFDKHSTTWRREQDGLLRKIQDIQKATPAPIDQAIDMLRLTSRASQLFLQQPAIEQRRLLKTVVEKASWKDGILQTALFEPFEILRQSNQESSRKEKEMAGSGHELGIWLRGQDSNL